MFIPVQPGAFAAGQPAQQHVPAPASATSSPPQQHMHLLPGLAALQHLQLPLQLPPCYRLLAGPPLGLATAGSDSSACDILPMQGVNVCSSRSVISSKRTQFPLWLSRHVTHVMYPAEAFQPDADPCHFVTKRLLTDTRYLRELGPFMKALRA